MVERKDVIPTEVRQEINTAIAMLLLEFKTFPKTFHWFEYLEIMDLENLTEAFGNQTEEVVKRFNLIYER